MSVPILSGQILSEREQKTLHIALLKKGLLIVTCFYQHLSTNFLQ